MRKERVGAGWSTVLKVDEGVHGERAGEEEEDRQAAK